MNMIKRSVLGLIAVLLMPYILQAQLLDPVSFTVVEKPDQVMAGEVFEITVRATIDGKWHLYSINNDPDAGPFPTKFTSANKQLVIAGDVQESEPSIEFDPNFETELGWHSTEATFTIPLAFGTDVQGTSVVDLEVQYQVCDDKTCLPPKNKTITAGIPVSGVSDSPYEGLNEASSGSGDQVGGAADGQDGTGEIRGTQGSASIGSISGEGIFSFLWLAITAGLAALLTPCVFPMIPLTVSYFSKQEAGDGTRAMGSAIIFGVAIVATFTILGILLAALIGASGANQFAANPWVNIFIGLVLVVFAFSLLGMFELRLPYQLTNWLNRKSNESSGMIGILFMALTISAVSFSCTAPFVGAVLAATTGGEWFYPIIGMVGFSAAFASPFVLFAMFPHWLESLPQSGSWMNIVKVLLGYVELAAAIKFISNADLVWNWGIVSRPFAIAAWIAIFFLAGLYVLGVYALRHEQKPEQIGTGRLLLSLPLLIFSFYLIPGLLGASLGIWDSWLPPKQATDVSVVYSIAQTGGAGDRSGEFENWSSNYDESVENAKESAIPVFIDFTGYTCTNCRAMETNVFPLTEIQQRFEQMERVRLYTDDGVEGPDNQKFQFQLTGTVALPTYVIVDPYSERVLAQLVGYANKDKFQQFLDNGLSRFEQNIPNTQTGMN